MRKKKKVKDSIKQEAEKIENQERKNEKNININCFYFIKFQCPCGRKKRLFFI